MAERILRETPKWIELQDINKLGFARVSKVVNAAKLWHRVHTFNRNLTISPYTDNEEVIFVDGSREQILEVASPGLIQLGKLGNPENITYHAMTHAVAPDKPTMLEKPIDFGDGFITGYHGLAILIQLLNGIETKFRKIEEGICERNAVVAKKTYMAEHRQYHNVGKLALSKFPSYSSHKPADWARSNDIPALVRAHLRLRSDTEVKPGHVLTVMKEYMEAWNG